MFLGVAMIIAAVAGLCSCERGGEEVKDSGIILYKSEIEVGVDFLHSPRSYDVILQVTLASREALDTYQNDPYHVSVVKAHMHAVVASSVAIDYDLD